LTDTILRHVADAYVVQDKATTNFSGATKLRLSGSASQAKYAYLFFGGGPRPGVFVVSAVLRLYTRGDWTGSPTLTVKRVTSKWKEGTITWRRQPDVTSSGNVAVSTSTLGGGDPIEFDVTTMVRTAFLGSGTPFFGFQISSTGSSDRDFHSGESPTARLRPVLEITYTTESSQPIDLTPGNESVVSVSHPVLGWRQFDVDGDEQAEFRVQIDATDVTTGTPDFDSGWIISPDPEYDLSTSGFSGITNNTSVEWRVATVDDSGQQSAWSDPAVVTRTVKGTLSILSPSSQVEEATPEIATVLTGQDQSALSYLIEEQQPDGTWIETWEKPHFPAEVASGLEYEFEVTTPEQVREPRPSVRYRVLLAKPAIRRKDRTYRLTVRSWDDVEHRAATPGDPIYVEEQIEFTWVESVSAPPGTVSRVAEQEPYGPGVKLTWSRTAVPAAWSLTEDGILVLDKIDATEPSLGDDTYQLIYYGSAPGIEHTYEIQALEGTA
jgi:hypothetical protein